MSMGGCSTHQRMLERFSKRETEKGSECSEERFFSLEILLGEPRSENINSSIIAFIKDLIYSRDNRWKIAFWLTLVNLQECLINVHCPC